MIKLDIVIPLYNKGKYIGELLGSLLRYQNLYDKIIIVDDCSTDNSVAIVEEYRKANPETIVLHQQEKNQGPHYARLKGSEISDKTHVMYIDADDLVDFNGFSNLYNKDVNWSKYGLYFGHILGQGGKKNDRAITPISNGPLKEVTKPINLLRGPCPTMSSIIVRKDVTAYMSVGECDWGEDILFHVNTLNKGIPFLFIGETMGIYRIVEMARGSAGGKLKKRLRFISLLFSYSLKKVSLSNIAYFLFVSSRTLLAWLVKLFR